jgi:hypothetical protein
MADLLRVEQLCSGDGGRGAGTMNHMLAVQATWAFWERNGFIQIDTINPLPGWQPGNPAAIYVAAFRPTR